MAPRERDVLKEITYLPDLFILLHYLNNLSRASPADTSANRPCWFLLGVLTGYQNCSPLLTAPATLLMDFHCLDRLRGRSLGCVCAWQTLQLPRSQKSAHF